MLQELMEENVAAQYPIGLRIARGDWVLRYCKAGSAGISHPNRGAANGRHQLEGTCIGNAVAGEKTLDIPLTCADFPAVTYTAEDIYKDGFIWIRAPSPPDDPTWHEMHRIRGNDEASGGKVRLHLFEPLQHSHATPWITAYPSIYGDVEMDYPSIPSVKQSVVCVPLIVVQANYYFWGLTWGPMWSTAMGDTPGFEGRQRDVYFWQGGVIALAKEVDLVNFSHQRAGYILPNTEHTGDMCFMLQLAP